MVEDYFICFYIYVFHIYAIMDYKHQVCVDEPILLPNTILAIANLAFYSVQLDSCKCSKHEFGNLAGPRTS